MSFIKRYGGYAQLQYYWTNEIFTNVNFGFEKAFGFNNARNVSAPGGPSGPCWGNGFFYANPNGYDPINSVWQSRRDPMVSSGSGRQVCPAVHLSKVNYFQNTHGPAGANSAQSGTRPHLVCQRLVHVLSYNILT